MGKKLTVYMIDGTEYGPRFSEIGNWVGKAIYSPRAAVNRIITRPEFDNPGIYCLKGDPSNEVFEERIYIGETENIRARLKQHLNDPKKDFKEFIFFISKDDFLTKTQIKYLESRLIQLAIEAKTAEIENGNSPNLPTLHEADISDMEYFLDQMKLILPVMGFNFLIASTIKNLANEEIDEKQNEKVVFQIKSPSFQSQMYESDQGYIIIKGSEAKKVLAASITETFKNFRQKLIETGILIDKGDKLEFTEDTIFSSPSAAANMVLGRSSNGFIEWVNNKDQTFKKVQELINN